MLLLSVDMNVDHLSSKPRQRVGKMAAEEVMKRINRFPTTEMVWRFTDQEKPRHYGMYVPDCPLNLVYLDVITARFRSNSPIGLPLNLWLLKFGFFNFFDGKVFP